MPCCDTARVLALRGDGRALRIGHRGAAALAPENTLRSLAAAVEAGADIVELDVLEVQGALVLGHSRHELPLERATLDEALALLAPAGVGIHVDVKATGLEEPIVRALAARGLTRRAYVSARWPETLRRFAEAEPELARALSYPVDRLGVSRSRWFGPLRVAGAAGLRTALPARLRRMLAGSAATIASLHYAVVSRSVVERSHALRAPVLVWTVNEPALARRLDALGVDGIVSDDPRMLAATLRV